MRQLYLILFVLAEIFFSSVIQANGQDEVREMSSAGTHNNSKNQEKLDKISGFMRSMNDSYKTGPPEEMNQLMFLVGEWETTIKAFDANGEEFKQDRGAWRARLSGDERMIIDEYDHLEPDGTIQSSSTTLRTYSPFTNQWEMTSLYAMRPSFPARFNGKMVGEEFLATMSMPNPDGLTTLYQIRFFNISNNEFDWEHKASWDNGENWTRMLLVNAVRVK